MAGLVGIEQKYAPLDIEDIDLEDDTSTACSERYRDTTHNDKRDFKRKRRTTCLTWFRWGSIVFLQGVMILLLVRTPAETTQHQVTETGGDINGLYVPESHSYVELVMEPEKYVPNMTTDANRAEVRHNWDMLMPLGSGTVKIPNWKEYPLLGEPIVDDPIRSGPIFEASWTHALHCLYYTVDSYHQLLLHGRNGEENPYHATHCFEYLRNNILCMADMTLEGNPSAAGEEGRGQPHVCRNREEAIAWIEERRVDDLQDIVGP